MTAAGDLLHDALIDIARAVDGCDDLDGAMRDQLNLANRLADVDQQAGNLAADAAAFAFIAAIVKADETRDLLGDIAHYSRLANEQDEEFLDGALRQLVLLIQNIVGAPRIEAVAEGIHPVSGAA